MIHSSSTILKQDVIVTEMFLVTTFQQHRLLLGNLRTNREQVILPSSQAKLRENTPFIDQLAFGNFALYYGQQNSMEESFDFNADSFLATIYKPTINYDATLIMIIIILLIIITIIIIIT